MAHISQRAIFSLSSKPDKTNHDDGADLSGEAASENRMNFNHFRSVGIRGEFSASTSSRGAKSIAEILASSERSA